MRVLVGVGVEDDIVKVGQLSGRHFELSLRLIPKNVAFLSTYLAIYLASRIPTMRQRYRILRNHYFRLLMVIRCRDIGGVLGADLMHKGITPKTSG